MKFDYFSEFHGVIFDNRYYNLFPVMPEGMALFPYMVPGNSRSSGKSGI